MATEAEFDQALEQYQHALREFIQGNPQPALELFSHSDAVTLANPVAPPAHGWQQVEATTTRAAARLSDVQLLGCEIISKYVTPELDYVVWIEHEIVRVGGSAEGCPLICASP